MITHLLYCPKKFRHLVSAMIHIDRHASDKERIVDDLRIGYAAQLYEPDPVVWLRKKFDGKHPYPDGIFIRPTFTARTYQEAKSNS